MKNHLKGFIPAYLIQYNFMLGLLNDLREKRIDALEKQMQEIMAKLGK